MNTILHHLWRARVATVAALFLACALAVAPAAASDAVNVQARKNDDAYIVDVTFTVPASATIAWDVLTDFEGMEGFISSVTASRIVNRQGNAFDVDQEGRGKLGPIPFTYTNVRRVQLVPRTEIVSTLVESDNLKSSDFTTRIAPQGTGAAVTVRGTFVPGFFASTVITIDKVKDRMAQLYEEMRDEMVRRARGDPRPACLAARNCPRG